MASKKEIGKVGKNWTAEAIKQLLGREIVQVRYLSEKEQQGVGWYDRCVVIQLDDGSLIYPSRDDEGNDDGALVGQTSDGDSITLPVI